jgi:cytochrome P450
MFFFVFFTFDYSWTFGESFGCLENMGRKVPFAEALNELLEISSGRLVDPIWRLRESISPVGTNVRQNKAVMRQHIHRIIAKHREQDWSDPNKKSNLLMMYMEAKGVDGQPYSDELLVDTMMTLLVRKQTS